MFSDVLRRKHWGRGCLPISPWEAPGGVEGVWGWVLGVFHYFFFELDAEMSLPHSPSWPLCSLSLFSSPLPVCPSCSHRLLHALPAGISLSQLVLGCGKLLPNPPRFLLASFILPKALPFPTQGREGAAGTSWMMELLLPPWQGSTWTGPARGICRSGGARSWERRWWPRSALSHPFLL